MICDRCKKEKSVLITCSIKLTVGGKDSPVRTFHVCPECADEICPLLEEAIDSTVLNK